MPRPLSLPTITTDIAVIGLGALGASTLWRLAERGVDVLGIDQFVAPHAYGSTHGKTRLFRTICLEHPELGNYARLSRTLFDELSVHAGESLLDITGGVMMGAPDSDAITGTLRAAAQLGLDVAILGAPEIAQGFPQFASIDPQDIAIIDPEAGVARPEAFVAAALARSEALGAQLMQGVRVQTISQTATGLRIETPAAVIEAQQIVAAAGVWLETLVPGLPLDPVRTTMTWFAPTPGFALADFPVFIREITPTLTLWGHGALPGGEAKIGLADVRVDRPAANLANIDRGVTLTDIDELEQAMARYLPGIGPRPSRVDPCVITRTPDHQFLIGRVPAFDGRVVVAGGCSGHAFKHAPAIGEAAAAIVSGETPRIAVDFVDPRRFG